MHSNKPDENEDDLDKGEDFDAEDDLGDESWDEFDDELEVPQATTENPDNAPGEKKSFFLKYLHQGKKSEEHKTEMHDDDDIELDEFEDDLTDESWDEFDDELEISEELDEETLPPPQKKKSFFLKHFNIILIAFVLAGVGFVFLNQGGTPQQEAADPQSLAAISDTEALPAEQRDPIEPIEALEEIEELSSGADLPPMPTPMSSVPGERETVAEPPLQAVEVLTPMPEVEELPEIPLPELDIPAVATELAQIEEDIESEVEPELEMIDDESSALGNFTEELSQIEAATPPPEEETALFEEPFEEIIEEPVQMPPESPIVENTSVADSIARTEFSRRIETLEQNYSSVNSGLSKKINDTNDKIDRLSEAMMKLEKQLNTLAESQHKAPVAQHVENKQVPVKEKPPQPKEETAQTPDVIKQKPKSKPKILQEKPPRAPVPAPAATATKKWKLRSAQPGKASVSNQQTGDLLTVETGDSLAGIGKIKSISIENGKWVVRGTEGYVSQ